MTGRKPAADAVIFTAAVYASAWASAAAGPGAILIWMLTPLAAAVVIRLVAGNRRGTGLKPFFRGSFGAYLLSILFFPAAVSLVTAAGKAAGVTDFQAGPILFIQTAAGALVFNLVKNVFEEFSWRGFLTPVLHEAGLHPLLNHLLTGLIWGGWHIPYYLFLTGRQELASYTGLNLPLFITLSVMGMVSASILFGEIRLFTGSCWPAVILHTLSNALILTMLNGGFTGFTGNTAELIFTPGWHGILMMVLMAGTGLAVYRLRKRGL